MNKSGDCYIEDYDKFGTLTLVSPIIESQTSGYTFGKNIVSLYRLYRSLNQIDTQVKFVAKWWRIKLKIYAI